MLVRGLRQTQTTTLRTLTVGLFGAWSLTSQSFAESELQRVIEEVVVTASGVARTRFESRESVVVFTDEDFRRATERTLTELLQRVPNVTLDENEDIVIRGLPRGGLNAQNPAATSEQLFDDLRFIGSTAGLFDLDQVEILRGPHVGTLANAIGGVVALRSRKPALEPSAHAMLQYAPDGEYREAGLALGRPMGQSRWGVRFAGHARTREGFVENVLRDDDAWADNELYTGRVGVLWKPDAETRLLATYMRQEQKAGAGRLLNRVDPQNGFDVSDREVSEGVPIGSDESLDFASFEIERQLGRNWSITGIYGYQRRVEAELSGTGPSRERGFLVEIGTDVNLHQILVRASRSGAVWSVAVAATPTLATFDSDRTISFALDPDGSQGPLDPARVGQVFEFRDARFLRGGVSAALSGNIGPWSVEVALRWAGSDDEIDTAAYVDLLATSGDDSFDGLLRSVFDIGVPPEAVTRKTNNSSWTWATSLAHRLRENITLGFSAETAVRPGYSYFNAPRQEVFPYETEYSTSYEFYVRTRWLNGRVAVDANTFYTRYRDQQIFTSFPDSGLRLDNVVVNAGKSRISGLEFDAHALLGSRWSMWLGLGLLDTKLDDVDVLNTQYVDQEYPNAPDTSVSFGLDHSAERGLSIHFDAAYQSKSFAALPNDPDRTRASRFVVNGRIGWRFPTFDVSLYGRNLFDTEYFDLRDAGNQIAVLGDPRQVGLRLSADW